MSEEKEVKEKKRGVGDAAMEAILGGATNEEALAAVQKEFPDKKTTLASINWYRNKLRADGKDVKTSRELKKANAPEKPAKPAKAKEKEAEAF